MSGHGERRGQGWFQGFCILLALIFGPVTIGLLLFDWKRHGYDFCQGSRPVFQISVVLFVVGTTIATLMHHIGNPNLGHHDGGEHEHGFAHKAGHFVRKVLNRLQGKQTVRGARGSH